MDKPLGKPCENEPDDPNDTDTIDDIDDTDTVDWGAVVSLRMPSC